jgi:HK97 family phage portal protein
VKLFQRRSKAIVVDPAPYLAAIDYATKQSIVQAPLGPWLKGEIDADTTTPQGQINQSYKSVIWFYAAVNLLAKAVSTMPLKLYKRGSGSGDAEVLKHPVLDRLTYRPNEFQSATDLREFFVAMLHITGNAYLYAPMATLSGSGNRLFIRNLLSQHVEVRGTGNPANPVEYFYKGMQTPYPKSDVIHWKFMNPDSELCGLSPVAVARRTIASHSKSKIWNESLLDHRATPSGVLVTDTVLDDPVFLRLKKQIDESWGGSPNAGRPKLLEAGMKWQQLSMSPQDMDWLQSQKLSMREICALVGVPSELLGDNTDKSYASAKEARIAMYDFTAVPLANRECDLYGQFFFPGNDFYFKPDTSLVDALKKNLTELTTALAAAWWLTPNQRLVMMGIEESTDAAMSKVYVPSNLIPIEMAALGSGSEGVL